MRKEKYKTMDLTAILRASGAQETETVFRPVQCRERDLKDKTPVNGFLYFTTDTNKIFLGRNGEFVSMGGASGVYYGKRPFSDDEIYGDDILFKFDPSHIDGTTLPAIDDLIINIPDGGLYRVLDVSPSAIDVQRLMIAGGGGGGGTGGTGAIPTVRFYRIWHRLLDSI